METKRTTIWGGTLKKAQDGFVWGYGSKYPLGAKRVSEVMSAMVGTLPDAFTNEFLSLTDHLPVTWLGSDVGPGETFENNRNLGNLPQKCLWWKHIHT